MSDPERIWLAPVEAYDPTYGRSWCEADEWEGEGIKYIRADLVPELARIGAATLAAAERDGPEREAMQLGASNIYWETDGDGPQAWGAVMQHAAAALVTHAKGESDGQAG